MQNWDNVADRLRVIAGAPGVWLNAGQRDSLRVIADRLPDHGLIIADEVGMGKTRIAVAVARAVVEAGGRVAILIPAGLGDQWQTELNAGEVPRVRDVIRSLWTFLSAWDEEDAPRHWFDESVVLVSHGLANWRLGLNAAPWRFELLHILIGLARKASGRAPHGFNAALKETDDWARRAAEGIATHCASAADPVIRDTFAALRDTIDWRQATRGENYGSDSDLRASLQQAVGLGLGSFDLLIVDEAHKSRREESGLSRLLERTILPRADSRRLCMTATPVELSGADWTDMLTRIQLDVPRQQQILLAVAQYGEAVRRVRLVWRSSAEAREAYVDAAAALQKALGPFVLRRDKRADEAVIQFRKESTRAEGAAAANAESYRWQHEIAVTPAMLSPEWQQAVCAAEALSFVASGVDDPAAKRLRLTFGSGHGINHGIAGLIDAGGRSAEDTQRGEDDPELETVPTAADEVTVPTSLAETKRLDRVDWWIRILSRVAQAKGALHDHPHILAAVAAIEAYHSDGEKVLVFGRFTSPLRALTELLNARAMLRALDAGEPWPQRNSLADEVPAIEAAHRQLGRAGDFDKDALDDALTRQYGAEESRRGAARRELLDRIVSGIDPADENLRRLADAARGDAGETETVLATALEQHLDGDRRIDLTVSNRELAEAFASLISEFCEPGKRDTDRYPMLSTTEAGDLWRDLFARLKDEYGSGRGRFARLMIGATSRSTRRTLQHAFNRPHSQPRVLVANSMVGREGLNLHGACRVVVLLHPEWNPGVVEQQIGRVDRVESHWARGLTEAIRHGRRPLPRIEVRPVIFEGTYDSHHWAVLMERWDDLRAQLHGVVVPYRLREGCTEEEQRIIRYLEAAAPDFSPTQTGTRA
ncbi:DEAD/DEAH box helicase [Sphingomonas sp. Leaf38]|uniref:DEAD/DEAH box helicase n=1 Tax=Sphingomonas sp. Leaf38 TaxID=1736217 RepID=UPI001F1EB5EE|nr:DEAD/DEAH box helicase [Sphingomonas sp. Leaf38]